MGYIGGDVKSIEFNHKGTLGSKTVFPKKGEEGNLIRPGVMTADDDANVTAVGQSIDIMTYEKGSFEILCANDNVIAKEAKFMKQLSGDPLPSDIVINYISGAAVGAVGKPVGTITESSNATFTLKIAFDGEVNDL